MKCKKCGGEHFRRDNIELDGISFTCIICGRVRYFLPPKKLVPKEIREKVRAKVSIMEMTCECHKVLGGRPCGKRFMARARNAKYHPDCRKAANREWQKVYHQKYGNKK